MKNFNHLLFLSVIFSLLVFNNCSSDDNEPTVDDDVITILDADNDGVSDDKDTCANTPSGATVDTNGCAVVESLFI